MPERGQQFPKGDFLAEHGFTSDEQLEAEHKATNAVTKQEGQSAFIFNLGQKIMGMHSPEGQEERKGETKTALSVHGYKPHQVEHTIDEDGEVYPAAVHHHGDFSAHWEPGHDVMFVHHKSQDRATADPIASIRVSHLHKQEGAHIPTANQQALEDWHSNPENVATAMGKLKNLGK